MTPTGSHLYGEIASRVHSFCCRPPGSVIHGYTWPQGHPNSFLRTPGLWTLSNHPRQNVGQLQPHFRRQKRLKSRGKSFKLKICHRHADGTHSIDLIAELELKAQNPRGNYFFQTKFITIFRFCLTPDNDHGNMTMSFNSVFHKNRGISYGKSGG